MKPHSIPIGDLGSGLLKMLAIGLGKQAGADAIHRQGLQEHFLPAARLAAARASVALGLGLVENAYDRTARVEAVLPADLEAADLRLLKLARSYLPTIPFDPLDVLIVRQIAKDISAAGMDPNVIGMHRRLRGFPERTIRRIVALSLSAASHGNPSGAGMADLITDRLRDAIDHEAMAVNALTSDFPWGIKLPLSVPTDQEAIALALRPFTPETIRAVVIQDTARLDTMWVSEALMNEAWERETLEVVRGPRVLGFDGGGSLTGV